MIALLLALFAQQTPPPPPTYGETLEVRVINVDVIVTTRDGKPVTGLPKDAFELTANGQKRDISNFLEITSAPAPPPSTPAKPEEAMRDLRARKIVFFIDNASLGLGDRTNALKSLRRLLDQGVRPGDGVMITTWNGQSVSVPLQLTTDRAAMEKAYADLSKQSAFGAVEQTERQAVIKALIDLITVYAQRSSGRDAPPEQPPYDRGIGEVHSYAGRALYEMRLKVEGIKSVIAALRGIEGRKALVVLTENLGANPAYAAFDALDQLKDRFDGGSSQNPMGEVSQFEVSELVDSIADAANSASVALYTIHAGGASAEQQLGDASDSGIRALLPRASSALSPDLGTLQTLASATGGASIVGSSNFEGFASTILSDLDSYYSLGYRAEGPDQDRVTTVAVKLKSNPNKYVVRTRRTIVETSSASAMRDAVVANLFYPAGRNDMRVALSAGAPAPATDGKHITVPLKIIIPMDQLTLLPDGNDLTGRIDVVGSFLRKDGVVSKIDRTQQSFRFPADSLKRRKELTLNLNVMAELGTEGVSIGIMDAASKATGFASTKLAQ